MNWYPWLNAPYRQIIARYQDGRGHHALLIHALKGSGVDSLCYAISRWLMCRQPEGMKSCGHCHSCQLMMAGNHPDFYRPEPEKGRSSLGVDSIRQVIDPLYNHAQQGGAKVVWLSDAEALTEQAANALLKTLEEPPDRTYFLLACREPSHLLPTLRSRCLYRHLPAPDEPTGSGWLLQQGIRDAEQARTALRLYNGAPLAALDILQPARWAERQGLCDGIRQALARRDLLSLLPFLNKDKDDEPLYWLLTLLTDALKWQAGAVAFAVNQDQRLLVEQLGARFPSGILHHQLHQWLECRRQWQTISGINRELLLTNQLLNWDEAADVGAHPWSL
jgi:DNA polymerase-3 subunit delta'